MRISSTLALTLSDQGFHIKVTGLSDRRKQRVIPPYTLSIPILKSIRVELDSKRLNYYVKGEDVDDVFTL